MKVRIVVAILVTLSLGLAGCGGDDGGDALDIAADQEDTVVEPTDDSDADSDADADADADVDADFDLDDMPENLDECLGISMTYAGLALASLGELMGGEKVSDADLAEMRKAIEDLEVELPEELQEDFAIVAQVYSQAADEGFMSTDAQEALESDEFTEADARIQEHLAELCG